MIGLILDDKDFKLKEWIEGKKSTVLNSDYNASVLDDMMIYLIGGGVVLFLLILIVVLAYICRKHKEKLMSKVK